MAMLTSSNPKTSISLWHSRLGHPSFSILNTIVSQFSLPIASSTQKHLSCSDCLINKSHKLPFTNSSILSSRPLEYIFSDVWSSPILSVDNYKYYVVFIDHYSRYTWLYPLKLKSQVKEVFIAYKALVENKFQTSIGTLFSDNGGEYIALRSFLSTHGITHLTSPPHTPQHNGLSERKHRHIVETGLTLLSTASIPKKYWTFAFSTAVYLINRLLTPTLSMKSPFQILFGVAPNYEKLRVFGCLCFPWLRPYNAHKLQDKSQPCVFLGYSPTQSAYFCLDRTTNRIYTSRHVQFVETLFPFQEKAAVSDPQHTSTPTAPASVATTIPVMPPEQMGPVPETLHPTAPPPPQPQVLPSHSSPTSSSSSSEPTALSQNESQTPIQPNLASSNEPTAQEQNELQPPTQQTQQENISQTQSPMSVQPIEPENPAPENHQNIHQMKTKAKNNITKPIQKLTLHLAGPKHQSPEPTTIIQAMKDKKWRDAAIAEFDAHIVNHTWDLEPPSHDQNVIGCRWLFTTKYLSNGQEERRKGRLVAKGYTQRYGVDYSETFIPVIKSTTIRLVIEVAVTKSWTLKQLDINNAFLQGDLTEVVYMMQPPGFVDKDHPDHVCRLRKPIYGLKQAPRSWYLSLRHHLLTIGFINSTADASLFVHTHGHIVTYVLVYVDDILVTGSDPAVVQQVLQSFAERFSINDPVDLHYFLGIEAVRTPQGLHLMQRKYVNDLLGKQSMVDAKPVSTPLPTSPKLTLAGGTLLNDAAPYRSLVGSL
ncbi:hypothetical protein YC2023_014248 [Brassica napus]